MMANMKSLSTKSKTVSSSPKYVQGIPAARPIIYGLNTAQAYHLSLVGFAHANQGLEWWAAVPILHQSNGIWGLSDTSQQQKCLRYYNKYMDFLSDTAAEVWDANSDSSEESDTE